MSATDTVQQNNNDEPGLNGNLFFFFLVNVFVDKHDLSTF